jgi:hypothetical protein
MIGITEMKMKINAITEKEQTKLRHLHVIQTIKAAKKHTILRRVYTKATTGNRAALQVAHLQVVSSTIACGLRPASSSCSRPQGYPSLVGSVAYSHAA